jgi:hypothetical protein
VLSLSALANLSKMNLMVSCSSGMTSGIISVTECSDLLLGWKELTYALYVQTFFGTITESNIRNFNTCFIFGYNIFNKNADYFAESTIIITLCLAQDNGTTSKGAFT